MSAALPCLFSLVAVIVALPGATAVITPAPETRATFAALLLHAMVRPLSELPAESRTVAVAVAVAPGRIVD